MSKEAPQPGDLPEILARSLGDRTYASGEWQKFAAQHFVPLEPGAGAEPGRAKPVVDFALMVTTPSLREQRRRPH